MKVLLTTKDQLTKPIMKGSSKSAILGYGFRDAKVSAHALESSTHFVEGVKRVVPGCS